MANSLTKALGLLASLAALAAAHSRVDYLIIDGAQYAGFNPHMDDNTPNVVGWSTTVLDDGFVPPSNYSTPDIICHRDGAPSQAHAPVRAGDRIFIQWNGWPESHDGPVFSYLASCGNRADGCATIDKETLRFFKIDDGRPVLISDDGASEESGSGAGDWVTEVLIAANNSWTIEIPPTLAPGPYVLRHEIIALHFAYQPDGAQNYPQCFNLWVLPPAKQVATPTTKGKGGATTAAPLLTLTPASGLPASSFYHSTDPGIAIDIYQSLSTYIVPGPTVIPQAVMVSQAGQSSQVPTTGGTAVYISATSHTSAAPSIALGTASATLSISNRGQEKRHWVG